jgi:hypothetical protein
MKSVTIVAKDNNYSLQNAENYKNESEFDMDTAIEKYADLMIEYSKFIMEHMKLKNHKLLKFIIIRGLDTITNVFLNVLYFTKNIDLTYFHSQKSYYFYVEFVGQISDDEKMFLQLTSRDAVTYVYKKTVFDINNELKKLNDNVSNEFKGKLDILKSYIHLYQTYLLKIIHLPKIDISYISYLSKITEKLNKITNKSSIFTLENITEKLYHNVNAIEVFFDISHTLVKKILKKPEYLKNVEQKIHTEDFDTKISEIESKDKFVNWLLS